MSELERIAQDYGLGYEVRRNVQGIARGDQRNNYADYAITLTCHHPVMRWSVNTSGPTLDETAAKVLAMAAPKLQEMTR